MKCSICDKDKEDVCYTHDPYAMEICEEVVMDYCCDDCFSDRADEI